MEAHLPVIYRKSSCIRLLWKHDLNNTNGNIRTLHECIGINHFLLLRQVNNLLVIFDCSIPRKKGDFYRRERAVNCCFFALFPFYDNYVAIIVICVFLPITVNNMEKQPCDFVIWKCVMQCVGSFVLRTYLDCKVLYSECVCVCSFDFYWKFVKWLLFRSKTSFAAYRTRNKNHSLSALTSANDSSLIQLNCLKQFFSGSALK